MVRALLTLQALMLSFALPALALPQGRPRGDAPSPTAVLAAEAARAETGEQLDVLFRAARLGPPDLQRVAVRALGRLERPQLETDLLPFLSSTAAGVRGEAANALAQAAGQDATAARLARRALFARLSPERNPEVRGAICESLGRLPLDTLEDASAVERVLTNEATRVALKKGVTVTPAAPLLGVRIGWGGQAGTATSAGVGALRGLESLLRRRPKAFEPLPATIEQLRRLATTAVPPARRLAFLALQAVAAADLVTIDKGLGDEDIEVRRLAAAAAGATVEQVQRGLRDPVAMVRYEALRAFGRRFQAGGGCLPVVAAARDSSPHVALLALDLLGNSCRPDDHAAEVLLDAVAALSGPLPAQRTERAGDTRPIEPGQASDPVRWHRPAHAIVSLAKVSPERAGPMLQRFLAAEPWQVRMYAARAAAELEDAAALQTLAADTNPNVQEAAIRGLAKTEKHAADTFYLRALASPDGQLTMAAAEALKGTPDREAAVPALVAALQAWTAGGSDTSRDPRLAILEALQELGSAATTPALAPLLRDFDSRVAERAAKVLTSWTGEPHAAAPVRRPAEGVPSSAELARFSRSTVRVTMVGGATFDVRLLADIAPLSCARFARLIAAGYYNGLTFHRVVPNFVIQGGSPGANEFSGDRRFMLDEVARATQARGTLGTSTRGRDTGDAQVYINLVDNPRLDHDYTVFGEVVRGMDTVDAILEGDVILRVVLRSGS